jgi:hypothetical protein
MVTITATFAVCDSIIGTVESRKIIPGKVS